MSVGSKHVIKCWHLASFSRFSDVSEEELNALIQKATPEKTKIAGKYGILCFEDSEKSEFEVSI